jgi:hypothetical protein
MSLVSINKPEKSNTRAKHKVAGGETMKPRTRCQKRRRKGDEGDK